MNTSLKRVGILGTGSMLPERELTNFDMEKIVDTSNEWIITRTGIESRRFGEDGEGSSDYATEASKKALEMAGLTAEDIDLIIVGTCTPDYHFPSTACLVQKNLGATKAAAFDVEAACSGFLYSMTIAEKFISTGMYKHVLVIGAEKFSGIMDFEDRNTCILFGDGAGAAVMGPVEDGKGILSMELGADGSKGDVLIVPAGGSVKPATLDTVNNKEHFIQMDGSEVFKFAARIMGNSSKRVIAEAGLELSDIDYLIPHQANIRIINSAAKKLKLPLEKIHVNLNKYGNTSAASIPIALDEALRAGKINEGDNVVLVGFGAGLTWGSLVMKW